MGLFDQQQPPSQGMGLGLEDIFAMLAQAGIDPMEIDPVMLGEAAPFINAEIQKMGLGAPSQMQAAPMQAAAPGPDYSQAPQLPTPMPQQGPPMQPTPPGLGGNFVPEGYDEQTQAYIAEEEKWAKRKAYVDALAVVGGDFGNVHNTIPLANKAYMDSAAQSRAMPMAVEQSRHGQKMDWMETDAKSQYYGAMGRAADVRGTGTKETDKMRTRAHIGEYFARFLPPEHIPGAMAAWDTGSDEILAEYLYATGAPLPVDRPTRRELWSDSMQYYDTKSKIGARDRTDDGGAVGRVMDQIEGKDTLTPGERSGQATSDMEFLDPATFYNQPPPDSGGGAAPRAAEIVARVSEIGMEGAIAELTSNGVATPAQAIAAIEESFLALGPTMPKSGTVAPGTGTEAPVYADTPQGRQARGKAQAAPKGPPAKKRGILGTSKAYLTGEEDYLGQLEAISSKFLGGIGNRAEGVPPEVQQAIEQALAMYPDHIKTLGAKAASKARTPEEALALVEAFLMEGNYK